MSFRDVEELLAQRGIEVPYETSASVRALRLRPAEALASGVAFGEAGLAEADGGWGGIRTLDTAVNRITV